jgi:hypothetical protein
VIQTSDGGYAVAGTRNVQPTDQDFWLAKIDSSGNMLWNYTYGKAEIDRAESVVQTSDGGYALVGTTENSVTGNIDVWLIKTDSTGNVQWNKTYGGLYSYEFAHSVVQTFDGGYALAGELYIEGADANGFGMIKTDWAGNMQWNRTWDSRYGDAYSVIQTSDEGYALAGFIYVTGASYDFCLVKTDADGNMQWNNTYGGARQDLGRCGIQTSDGGYALAGTTRSFPPAGQDNVLLVKTSLESGLAWTNSTVDEIILYRGELDPYWNYARVRVWLIKEPSWIYGDINMDGAVDSKDLYILSRNYGKTFSLLSLSGIVAIAGVRTVKKRKQSKQPNRIS